MTKREFVAAVSQQSGMSRMNVATVLDSAFAEIQTQLAKGETVAITGFGTFSVKHRAPREGVNLRTGEAVMIPAHKAPAFKAGKVLKDAVSGK